MSTITFIHAADFAFGGAVQGAPRKLALVGRRAAEGNPDAYRRIVDTAIEKQVDFVVVAGDIFDDSRPSYADFSLFVSGLERLNDAGIPVYFVTGNHDPFTSWDNAFLPCRKTPICWARASPALRCTNVKANPLH